jgi:hypothetical protein
MFQNVLFANAYGSLALMFSYCRYKRTVITLIALHGITYYFFVLFIKIFTFKHVSNKQRNVIIYIYIYIFRIICSCLYCDGPVSFTK